MPDEWHLVNAAVARDAADAPMHVNGMIEACKAGQLVNSFPRKRDARFNARQDRLHGGQTSPYMFVATSAHLGGRHASKRRRFHGFVAITAVEVKPADVK